MRFNPVFNFPCELYHLFWYTTRQTSSIPRPFSSRLQHLVYKANNPRVPYALVGIVNNLVAWKSLATYRVSTFHDAPEYPRRSCHRKFRASNHVSLLENCSRIYCLPPGVHGSSSHSDSRKTGPRTQNDSPNFFMQSLKLKSNEEGLKFYWLGQWIHYVDVSGKVEILVTIFPHPPVPLTHRDLEHKEENHNGESIPILIGTDEKLTSGYHRWPLCIRKFGATFHSWGRLG